MEKKVYLKIFRNFLAILCFFMAFIGGLLPLVQGWIFTIIGLKVLDSSSKEKIINYSFSKIKNEGLKIKLRKVLK